MPCSGSELRSGAEIQLNGRQYTPQAEVIQARLNQQTAWGDYLLGEYQLSAGKRLAFQYEFYADLDPATIAVTAYDLSYAQLLNGQHEKIITNLRAESCSGKLSYSLALQAQLFLMRLG